MDGKEYVSTKHSELKINHSSTYIQGDPRP